MDLGKGTRLREEGRQCTRYWRHKTSRSLISANSNGIRATFQIRILSPYRETRAGVSWDIVFSFLQGMQLHCQLRSTRQGRSAITRVSRSVYAHAGRPNLVPGQVQRLCTQTPTLQRITFGIMGAPWTSVLLFGSPFAPSNIASPALTEGSLPLRPGAWQAKGGGFCAYVTRWRWVRIDCIHLKRSATFHPSA